MIDEWIPVENKMPEAAGQPVLVSAVNKHGQRDEFIAYRGYGFEEWCTDDVTKMQNPQSGDNALVNSWKVTHWLPLPRVERVVDLVPESLRPKNEKFQCTDCGGFCYYPHGADITKIQYKFCPNCGKRVKGR